MPNVEPGRLMPLDVPAGCLACNPEPVRAYLTANGLGPERFEQCPPPRHRWSDVTAPCPECGATFMIKPKAS